jgi:hypothetical protein
MADVFFIVNEISDDLSMILAEDMLSNQRIRSRWVRALVRVAIAVVVTAAVIYTGGLAIHLLKMKGFAYASKKAFTAIYKTSKIGKTGKLYPAVMTGLGIGMKQAYSRMDVPWEGLAKEAKYSVKFAW